MKILIIITNARGLHISANCAGARNLATSKEANSTAMYDTFKYTGVKEVLFI